MDSQIKKISEMSLTDLPIPIAQLVCVKYTFDIEGERVTVNYHLQGNTGRYGISVHGEGGGLDWPDTRKVISVMTAYKDVQSYLLSKIKKP
jgi:hypothetical protein